MPHGAHRLVAFDAFGTLFSPRLPIAQQYATITKQFLSQKNLPAVPGLTEVKIQASFKKAFKEQRRKHPNYGHNSGLDPTSWWSQLIKNTIMPAFSASGIPGEKVFPELSNMLLDQFSSSKGYKPHDDAITLLKTLNKLKASDQEGQRTIIGVISNSDPRVRSILQSLGLTLGTSNTPKDLKSDLQFVVLSYETGFEKPLPNNFDIAERLARKMLPPAEAGVGFSKIYIGDDVTKDGESAVNAGWDAIIVDREQNQSLQTHHKGMQIVSSLWPIDPSLRWPWSKEEFGRVLDDK